MVLYEGEITPDIQDEACLSTELKGEVDSMEKMKLDLPSNIIKNKDDTFLPQADVKGKSHQVKYYILFN